MQSISFPVDELVDFIHNNEISKLERIVQLLKEVVSKDYAAKRDLASVYYLFPMLMDRIFGENIVAPPSAAPGASTASSTLPKKKWTDGLPGGWLLQMISLILASPSYFDATSRHVLVQMSAQDARAQAEVLVKSLKHHGEFVKLFFPEAPLFAQLDKLHQLYTLPTGVFSQKLQMYIDGHALYHCVQSAHHERLLALLSDTLPSDAQRQQIEASKQLRVGPMEYFLVCLVRYPLLYENAFAGSDKFHQHRKSPSDVLTQRGPLAWAQGVPYLVLLVQFFQEILLSPEALESTRHSAQRVAPGTPSVFTSSSHTFDGSEVHASRKQRLSELFLLLMVDSWIDVALVLHHNQHFAPSYRRSLRGGGALFVDDIPHTAHPQPTETVVLDAKSSNWTVSTLQSTYLLLFTLLRDRASILHYLDERAIELSANAQAQSTLTTPAWIILQQPVFDMLRCIFTKNAIPSMNQEELILGVEIWLLWIQPWKHHSQHRESVVLSEKKWKQYIAHNLHFYTTLLPCFLKTISGLNISSDEQGARNVALLERVLNVFTTELVDVVNSISNSFSRLCDELMESLGYEVIPSTPRKTKASFVPDTPGKAADVTSREDPVIASLFYLAKDQHERLFPDDRISFLPGRGVTDIASFSLEHAARIVRCIDHLQQPSQESKNDSIFSNIAHLIGLSDERAGHSKQDSKLNKCREMLFRIIPRNILSKRIEEDHLAHRGVRDDQPETSALVRNPVTGKLCPESKKLIESNLAKFDAHELDAKLCFAGDPLDLPCCSFESPLALQLTNAIAKYLNQKISLPKKSDFIHCSWLVAYQEISKTHPQFTAFHVLVQCFRFNLRVFTRYRVIGSLLLFFSALVIRLTKVLVWPLLPVFLVALIYLYEGSFAIKTKRKTR